MERRRFKQLAPLEKRLAAHARRLGKEAMGLPPGLEREKLIRRARQAETASDVSLMPEIIGPAALYDRPAVNRNWQSFDSIEVIGVATIVLSWAILGLVAFYTL